jgi:structural maintenance of chromosome 1
LNFTRLTDVEQKLAEMDKDTEKARKESKVARERFQAVKRQR